MAIGRTRAQTRAIRANQNRIASSPFITLEHFRSRTRPNGIDIIEQIIEDLQQSNEDVSIYDIEWSVVIRTTTITQGAAPDVRIPSWIVNYKATWQGHTFQGVTLNCAAFALAFWRWGTPHIAEARAEAYDIQTRFNWETSVTFAQIGRVVTLPEFADVRLIIYTPGQIRGFVDSTYSGIDYDPESARNEHVIFMVFDPAQKHYGLGQPRSVFTKFGIKGMDRATICHKCSFAYTPTRPCICGQVDLDEEPPPNVKAPAAPLTVVQARKKAKRKLAAEKACATCGIFGGCGCYIPAPCCKGKKSPAGGHRCILMGKEEAELWWQPPEGDDTEVYPVYITQDDHRFAVESQDLSPRCPFKLWAYDVETFLDAVSEEQVEIFAEDENGEFSLGEDGTFTMRYVTKSKHCVNLIVARSVFGDEEYIFKGDDCLDDFVRFAMTANRGRNILCAHNGSGYDSRLMLEHALQYDPNAALSEMGYGSKIMELKIGEARFRDTMLHFAGSLSRLAKDFGLACMKGSFPHMFNTPEHFDYIGPLPDLHYYDSKFSVRNETERKAFLAWHAAESAAKPQWDFAREYEEYCRNDVLILAQIMERHHTAMFDQFSLSPWFSLTTASFATKLLRQVACNPTALNLPPVADADAYTARIKEIAWNEGLAQLNDNEYWPVRKALRGGRVDVRTVYRYLTDEECARGWKIR